MLSPLLEKCPTLMYIRYAQIEPLAQFVIKHLEKKNLLATSKSGAELAGLITEVFRKNAEEEEKINDEARKLLDQNKRKLGVNIDEERALQMIKKQLAKDRNFVL